MGIGRTSQTESLPQPADQAAMAAPAAPAPAPGGMPNAPAA
jgi:hypothetical protein